MEYRVGLLPVGAEEHPRRAPRAGRDGCRGRLRPERRCLRPPRRGKSSPPPQEVYGRADMIVKVKEPQAIECKMLRPGQIVFTYFHLAADRQLTEDLLANRHPLPWPMKRSVTTKAGCRS